MTSDTSGFSRPLADASIDDSIAPLLEPLRTALAGAAEPDRYRVVASLLWALADATPAGTGERDQVSAERLASVARKLQAAQEENAAFGDRIASLERDVDHRDAQLDAEVTRAEGMERSLEEQRSRLTALQTGRTDLETQLQAKTREIYKLEQGNEKLMLNRQRDGLGDHDRPDFEQLEESNRALRAQVEELNAEQERLRTEKNAKIDALRAELRDVRAGASQRSDSLWATVWQRLARADPPLADADSQPDVHAAERLVDAFIVLAHFGNRLEQGMRDFLDRYTKDEPSVRMPWEAYAKRGNVLRMVRQIAPGKGGNPVGALKMKLSKLNEWTWASMLACDAAIESIPSELQSHLVSDLGKGAGPNRTVKDYLRESGHILFLQRRIWQLRSDKLAEIYGRGG